MREELQQGASQIKIMASGGVAFPTDPVANTQYNEAEIRAIVDEAHAANTYVRAHAYTPRAIKRAVMCGVRIIEYGKLIDLDTAKLIADHEAFAVPTQMTYEMLAEHGPRFNLSPESIAKLADVKDAGRRALAVCAEAGVEMGYVSDLLGEMHELLILSEVLGNLEALRSATTTAAKILQQEFDLGHIAAWAVAAVLIVNGNSLRDIRCLTDQGESITGIIQGGEVVKRVK